MAERRSTADPESGADSQPHGQQRRRLSAAAASREGLEQIAELTGKEPEGVSGAKRTQNGWTVTVEMVEDRRIPSSTDLLATYEAEIGDDGELLSYARTQRYTRGRGDQGGR